MEVRCRIASAVASLGIGILALSCNTHSGGRPIGREMPVPVPLGLPALSVPQDNPVTAETVALGRKLFYDPALSANNTLSCASCHNPLQGFADGRRVSVGVVGKTGTRNAPTVLNAAYGRIQFWDGRASSLEDQAAGPIANPIEMNQAHDVCVSKLNADPAYTVQFEKAFGPGAITLRKIQNAIAGFERTLLSGNSAFDRYYFRGDKQALDPAAARGFAIFRDRNRGNCASCHSLDEKSAIFSDGGFHNLGVGVDAEGALTDLGRFNQSKVDADRGAFKTPTLRNVARTAPYMHDGSFKTLRAVVDFYAGGGNSNPWLDQQMRPLNLAAKDRDDLVAFLESLTGEIPPNAGPPGKQ
jgi:cytochrome c peroxidase